MDCGLYIEKKSRRDHIAMPRDHMAMKGNVPQGRSEQFGLRHNCLGMQVDGRWEVF